MNNVYLHIGNYAKKPYYVKFSDISLYSIEELCYYFIDRIYLLDYDCMNQELVDWIRQECGLDALADELEEYIRKRVSVSAFVTTILEWTGLYEDTVVKKVGRVLKEQADLSLYERLKKRADYLYQTGRFRQAQSIYTQLLEQTPPEEAQKRATMYYNIASVYAMDYDYEQAASYYYEAYHLVSQRQFLLAYLAANRMAMTDYAYGTFMRENPQWQSEFEETERSFQTAEAAWENSREKEVLTQWKNLKQAGDMAGYYSRTGELLHSLKEDYRRQTNL